jgi:uncharacterized delta-60 repeat protein
MTLKDTFFKVILLIPLIAMSQDGSLDLSFSDNGKFIFPDVYVYSANDVAVGNSNNIFITGSNETDTQIIKLLSNGQIDTNFGNTGVATINTPNIDLAFKSIIQQDGKIVTVGRTTNDDFDFIVTRLNPDGTLDLTFGTNGIFQLDYGFGDDGAFSIIEYNDTFLIAGNITNSNNNTDFSIINLLQNGELNPDFGNNGISVINFDDNDEVINDIITNDFGEIFVCGRSRDWAKPYFNRDDFAVLKFNPDGLLDTSFGDNGLLTVDFFSNERANSIKSIGNSLLITGHSNDIDGDTNVVAIVKIDRNGNFDSSFGGDGTLTFETGRLFYGGSSSIIQNNGNLIFGGSRLDDDFFQDEVYIRIENNGEIDESFGEQGYASFIFERYQIYSLTKQFENKFLALGIKFNTTTNTDDLILTRHVLNENLGIVNYNNNSNNYLLYPNPASDKIFISNPNGSRLKVNLYDLYGKLIDNYSFTDSINDILLMNLSSGIYFVEIVSNGKAVINKLIIK